MKSKYSKSKNTGNEIGFFSGDTMAHFSNKRYRIYHRKLQKKQVAFHNDCLFYILESKSEYEQDKEIGINKNLYPIDYHSSFDTYKD